MKRVGVLVAVCAIFMILIINPSSYIDSCTRGNEAQEASFLTAADGAESSESITTFSETSADDTRLYPDADSANGFNEVGSSSVLNENETDVIWNDAGPIWWRPYRSGGYSNTGGASNSTMIEMWGYKSTPLGPVEIEVGYYLNTSIVLTNDHLFYIKLMSEVVGNYRIGFYNGSTEHYTASFPIAAETWTIITALDLGDIVTGTVSRITVENDPTDNYEAGANHSIWVDYHHLTDIPVVTNAEIYSESFYDVSDITVSVGETVTTDDDLGTFHHPGDNVWDYYFWNAPSSLAIQVIEWRCHANISSSSYEFALYSADDGGGSQLWTSSSITAPTSAATKKYSPMVTGVESIRLATNASSPAAFVFDYLRGSLSTEAGWAHDGSTTAGVTNNGAAGVTYTTTSDGDKLTLQAVRTSGSGTLIVEFCIAYDTTATSIDIERDYYPLIGIQSNVTLQGGASYVNLQPYIDGKYGSTDLDTSGSFVTTRINTASFTASSSYKYIKLYSNLNAVDKGFIIEIDWIKACSIANYTLTQSGCTIDDYLYVDSGVLHSHIDDGYIELNHDPAFTVNTAMYNVWNLTTSGTSPEFDNYVGSWAGYSSETRGSLASGTLTDFKLNFTTTEVLSAVKFIEDGTAPAVVRSSSTPNDPEDDESITLSAVITDTVEVYSVAFNAIVYPTGFSDVDYSATEQADNLWTYEFSSLITGYYCFKIVASDGANNNALTEYAYIELTVREAAIMVQEITLIGAGEDFSMMTFSARINRDCSYTIYEESASSAESDTHTGSVTAPSFNLAWGKLDVEDANVNFTIKFTSGSLTYNYTSQYQVAQTTFYVDAGQVEALDTVTVSGRISKLGNYILYDESDVLKDSGSITDLDFVIRFTKWSGYDEQSHDFAIKFTNGTQTCWYNSSYYAFKKAVVAPPATTDENVLYAFQVSFWTLIAVVAVGGMVAVDINRRYGK